MDPRFTSGALRNKIPCAPPAGPAARRRDSWKEFTRARRPTTTCHIMTTTRRTWITVAASTHTAKTTISGALNPVFYSATTPMSGIRTSVARRVTTIIDRTQPDFAHFIGTPPPNNRIRAIVVLSVIAAPNRTRSPRRHQRRLL